MEKPSFREPGTMLLRRFNPVTSIAPGRSALRPGWWRGLFLGAGLWLASDSGRIQAEDAAPPVALRGLDPVALCAGREEPGLGANFMVFGPFRYRFSQAEHQRAFRRDPERFALQWGGSDAVLGPFSPLASPELFHVHQGRIYGFTSQAGRQIFRLDPPAYLLDQEPVPLGSAWARKEGKRLADLALEGLGGARCLDRVQSLTWSMNAIGTRGSGAEPMTFSITALFPECFRRIEAWPTGFRCVSTRGRDGARTEDGRAWALTRAEMNQFQRELRTWPLLLWKARGKAGWRALAGESGDFEGQMVTWLTIVCDGFTTYYAVEPDSGRILGWRQPRPGASGVSRVTTVCSEYREVDGIRIPSRLTIKRPGTPAEEVWALQQCWANFEQSARSYGFLH